MQNLTNTARKYFLFLSIAIIFISCKKFIEVPHPSDQLTSELVFTNDQTAIQSITGIYSEMMNNPQQFSDGFSTLFAGMASDELYYYTSGFRDEFVKNQLTLVNHGNLESYFWKPAYRYIYAANKCIEGATDSKTLSQPVSQMVIGEARFIRAFCYFYLINFFGDVPLILSTDYAINQSLPRAPKATVCLQIINDLKDAENNLSGTYPTVERVRPNKLAATALLARVYLYNQDWSNADAEATTLINSNSYSLGSNLDAVFLKNSNETIWQLKPVNPSRNTYEGNLILPPSGSSTPTYLLTNSLSNTFELNDQRKNYWIKSRVFASQTLYYPYKYKVQSGSVLTEYYIVLRMAEQYLIRAEARAQQNNIPGSQADLNLIRTRAGLINTTANDKSTLLTAIEQERRVELFAEWGHRWFDLNRTNRANAVLSTLKPATWQTTDMLWPIPQNQLNLNPALTQNAGY